MTPEVETLLDDIVRVVISARKDRPNLAPAGIGDCDDCHGIAPLFEVSDPSEGAWAVCAQCAGR